MYTNQKPFSSTEINLGTAVEIAGEPERISREGFGLLTTGY